MIVQTLKDGSVFDSRVDLKSFVVNAVDFGASRSSLLVKTQSDASSVGR